MRSNIKNRAMDAGRWLLTNTNTIFKWAVILLVIYVIAGGAFTVKHKSSKKRGNLRLLDGPRQ